MPTVMYICWADKQNIQNINQCPNRLELDFPVMWVSSRWPGLLCSLTALDSDSPLSALMGSVCSFRHIVQGNWSSSFLQVCLLEMAEEDGEGKDASFSLKTCPEICMRCIDQNLVIWSQPTARGPGVQLQPRCSVVKEKGGCGH